MGLRDGGADMAAQDIAGPFVPDTDGVCTGGECPSSPGDGGVDTILDGLILDGLDPEAGPDGGVDAQTDLTADAIKQE